MKTSFARVRWSSLLRIAFCFLLLVSVPAFTAAATAGDWTGAIRCEIQVTAPGYSHQETQTWTLTGAASTTQGPYTLCPALWSVTGQGWYDRTGPTARRIVKWTAAVPGTNQPFRGDIGFSFPENGRMIVQLRHALQGLNDGYRGTEQYISEGITRPAGRLVLRLSEWPFERFEGLPTETQLVGSKSMEVAANVAPLQPNDAQVMITLTWALGRGSAPAMPPPTLPPPPEPPASPGAPEPVTLSIPSRNAPSVSPTNPRIAATPPAVTPAPAPADPVIPVAVPLDPALAVRLNTPPIKVVSPNGGENLLASAVVHLISWKHTLGATQKFDLDLSTDRGATWRVIRTAVVPRALAGGEVGADVTVIGAASTEALLRVRATGQSSPSDVSDAPFTLTAPYVWVITPVAGEKWKIGSKPSPSITWSHNLGAAGNFWISLSRDGGQTWQIINGWGLDDHGDWFEVSGPATTKAIIQVRTSTSPSIVAESAQFTIGF